MDGSMTTEPLHTRSEPLHVADNDSTRAEDTEEDMDHHTLHNAKDITPSIAWRRREA